MTTRERLHALVDELPEERLEDVELQLAAVLPEVRQPADVQAFLEALSAFAGLATAESHPEWATDEDIQNWIREA